MFAKFKSVFKLFLVWILLIFILSVSSYVSSPNTGLEQFVAHFYNMFTVSSNLGEAKKVLRDNYEVISVVGLVTNTVAIFIGIIAVALIVSSITGRAVQEKLDLLTEGMAEEVFDKKIDHFRDLRLEAAFYETGKKGKASKNFSKIIEGLYEITVARTSRGLVHVINIHEFETIFLHIIYQLIYVDHRLFETEEDILYHEDDKEKIERIVEWVNKEQKDLKEQHLENDKGNKVNKALIEAWSYFESLPQKIDAAKRSGV